MTQAFPLHSISAPKFGSWSWLRSWSLIVLLTVCLILLGCPSFASFVAAAEADLPIVLGIVTNITMVIAPGVSVALGGGGALAMTALVLACGNPVPGAIKCDPNSLVGQYQTATDPTIKASLLQKIQSALATTNQHIRSMLAIAKGLPPAVSAAIITAIGLALSTVTALIALLPAASQPAATQRRTVAAAQLMDAKSLKRSYNAAVAMQYPAAVLK